MVVSIHDNFLDEDLNNEIQTFFTNVSWKYGDKALQSMWKETLPHWTKYFYMSPTPQGVPMDDVTFDDLCIQSIYNKIKDLMEPGTHLLRCYANGHTCGNDSNIHYDDIRLGTITCIFYPMKEWNVDWCGETIFWDRDNREITSSIIPKSNRMLVFSSKVWHGARPVSRYCSNLRITLMFKFIKF